MAKKKSKKGNQAQVPMGPKKYIQTVARKLPVAKCYMPNDIFEQGMGHVVITRQMGNGNLVMGVYLVDTFCLGVKDCFYTVDMDPREATDIVDKMHDMRDADYTEVHNLILGAIEFAEEAGIPPHKDYAIGKYILDEDTDDIPLIEYDYGYKGKHHLIVAYNPKDTQWIPVLKKRLGKDFTYVVELGLGHNYDDEWDDEEYWDDEDDEDDDDNDDNWDAPEIDPETKLPVGLDIEQMAREAKILKKLIDKSDEEIKKTIAAMSDEERDIAMTMFLRIQKKFKRDGKEMRRNPQIEWDYTYPKYPTTLQIKHPIIASTFFTTDIPDLKKSKIKAILKLPHDEVARDIAQIILYKIGQTYKVIEEDYDNDDYYDHSLHHSLIFLAELGEPEGLDAIIELMRQTETFEDYFFANEIGNFTTPAIEACGQTRIADLVDFILSPNIPAQQKIAAIEGLSLIATHGEEKRKEVIEAFRQLLEEAYRRLPQTDGVDATTAAWIIDSAADLGDMSLKPLAEKIHQSGRVDRTIYGSFKNIANDFDKVHLKSHLRPIEKVYAQFK